MHSCRQTTGCCVLTTPRAKLTLPTLPLRAVYRPSHQPLIPSYTPCCAHPLNHGRCVQPQNPGCEHPGCLLLSLRQPKGRSAALCDALVSIRRVRSDFFRFGYMCSVMGIVQAAPFIFRIPLFFFVFHWFCHWRPLIGLLSDIVQALKNGHRERDPVLPASRHPQPRERRQGAHPPRTGTAGEWAPCRGARRCVLCVLGIDGLVDARRVSLA